MDFDDLVASTIRDRMVAPEPEEETPRLEWSDSEAIVHMFVSNISTFTRAHYHCLSRYLIPDLPGRDWRSLALGLDRGTGTFHISEAEGHARKELVGVLLGLFDATVEDVVRVLLEPPLHRFDVLVALARLSGLDLHHLPSLSSASDPFLVRLYFSADANDVSDWTPQEVALCLRKVGLEEQAAKAHWAGLSGQQLLDQEAPSPVLRCFLDGLRAIHPPLHQPQSFEWILTSTTDSPYEKRESLVECVRFATSDEMVAVALVKGGVGTGKTSLLAQLEFQSRNGVPHVPAIVAYHFCDERVRRTLDPALFVRSIASMIAMRLEAFSALVQGDVILLRAMLEEREALDDESVVALQYDLVRLESEPGARHLNLADVLVRLGRALHAAHRHVEAENTLTRAWGVIRDVVNRLDVGRALSEINCQLDPGGSFARGIVEPLCELAYLGPPSTWGTRGSVGCDSLVIVVDLPLTSNVEPGGVGIGDILMMCASQLPPWMCVVVSVTDEDAEKWSEMLNVVNISVNTGASLQEDITNVVRRRLREQGIREGERGVIAKHLAGTKNFLYATEALQTAGKKEFFSLPLTVPELFHWSLSRHVKTDGSGSLASVDQGLLEVLAAAAEPLPLQYIAHALDVEPPLLRDACTRLQPYVHPWKDTQDVFSLSSNTFLEWIRSSKPFGISVHTGHTSLVRFGRDELLRFIDSECSSSYCISLYTLEHFPWHLRCAGQTKKDVLRDLFFEWKWLSTKVEGFGLPYVLRDLAFASDMTGELDVEMLATTLRNIGKILGDTPCTVTELATQLLLRPYPMGRGWETIMCEPSSAFLRPLRPSILTDDPSLLHTIHGHSSAVTSLVLSPSGVVVYAGFFDGALIAWDTASGHELWRRVRRHTAAVESLAISSDGVFLVSGSADATMKVWTARTAQLDHTFAYGPDPEFESEIESESVTRENFAVLSVAVSHTDRAATRVAAGSRDTKIRIYMLLSKTQLLTLEGCHNGAVWGLCFTPDGHYLISSAQDNCLVIWSMEGLYGRRILLGGGWGRGLAVTPDQLHVLIGMWDGSIKALSLKEGVITHTFYNGRHKRRIQSLCVMRDGSYAITASDDQTVKAWNVGDLLQGRRGDRERHGGSGDEPLTFVGHCSKVLCADCTASGRIVSGGQDNTLRIWRLRRGTVARDVVGHGSPVQCVAVFPNCRNVVSGGCDNTLRVWDAISGRVVSIMETHKRLVMDVTVSPDGLFVISASADRSVKIFQAFTGVEVRTLEGHTDAVLSVCVSDDQKWLASASGSRAIKVHEFISGKELCTLEGHEGAVWSICFMHMAWRLKADRRGVSSPETDDDTGKEFVYIVSGSSDTTVRVWELLSRGKGDHEALLSTRDIVVLRGHTDRVIAVAITADCTHLVSGSADMTVRYWNLAMRQQIALFQVGSAVRSLSLVNGMHRVLVGTANSELMLLVDQSGDESRTILSTLSIHGDFSNAAVGVCGEGSLPLVVAGGQSGVVHMFELSPPS